jgi:hypothetical protein
MRHRFTFLAGIAVGFVVGARAGRERYEQMKKLGRRLAGSSAVQQASHTITIKSSQLTKSAASQVPKIAKTAKTKAGEHIPRQHRNDATVHDTGDAPEEADVPDGHDLAVNTTEYTIGSDGTSSS